MATQTRKARESAAERTARIEALAEAELARISSYVWDGMTLPVPVEHIADSHFGLYVREARDLSGVPGAPDLPPGQSLSGLLLPDRGEIWVSSVESQSWPARRRFTISHELGHWCMHRQAPYIVCRSAAVDPPARVKRPRRPATESEADNFAAAMLMPRYLMFHHYAQLSGRQDRFGRMCKLFGASAAAMGRRMRIVL
jgi:hypothetical protein